MNTQRSRLSHLSIAVAMAAVTLLVTVLSLQAGSPAYALPANIPALASRDDGPTVVATVTVGHGPSGVGVNPATNRVYVANMNSNTVSVIDGASQTVVATVTVGSSPYAVGVNPATNRVYVVNTNSNNVSVIDTVSNTVVATVPVGTVPYAVGVNLTTNRVYVSNYTDNTVSVIDGASNAVSPTIPVGSHPYGVGVNPTTNRVYVANQSNDTVSVIDGASNTVVATVTVGHGPEGIGVNPATNRIYVTNYWGGNNVSVIDSVSNTVAATVTVGSEPGGIGVNPTTDRVYVANWSGGGGNKVSVIDGASNTVFATMTVGSGPVGVGVNPTTNRVYVANLNSNTVSVIQDGAQLVLAKTGSGTGTVASNPAGINCGTDCTGAYAVGTVVALTATADPGSTFAGWSGDCAGYGDCALTLNDHKAVTATFATRAVSQTAALNVSGAGDYPFGTLCGSVHVTSTTATQITVTLVYTYPSISFTGLPRQYRLAANGDVTAAITLYYEQAELDWAGITDELLLHIYRYQNATNWQQYSKVDPVANTVTAYNVTELGVFGLGTDDSKPTALTLRDLTTTTNAWPGVIGMLGAVLASLAAFGAWLVGRRVKGKARS
jgi:YVTN family beta-propeller protein